MKSIPVLFLFIVLLSAFEILVPPEMGDGQDRLPIAGFVFPNAGAEQNSSLSLKKTFADDFQMGAAVSADQIRGEDPMAMELIKAQFNSLTPENSMKWERIQPLEGEFDWTVADALVNLAESNGMTVAGHVLVWHDQTPDWVFEGPDGGPASRELLLARMESHINTVVGRYRGRISSWEVVNEALLEDGSLRPSPWLEIIGEDYLALAFEMAHRADPDATLYYNDYNLFKPAKRAGAVRLVTTLQQNGVPISGVGMQGHHGLTPPVDLDDFEASVAAFAGLGDVYITELDVSVLPFPAQGQWGADINLNMELQAQFNPYPDGLPEDIERAQAKYYADLFRILLDHRQSVSRVTFWGVNDGHSWKNDWPMEGRSDYPLMFDRQNQPKRAAFEVVKLKSAR